MMVLRTDTHVVLDLTNMEATLLGDLLRYVAELAKERGPAWERVRMDILYGLPKED